MNFLEQWQEFINKGPRCYICDDVVIKSRENYYYCNHEKCLNYGVLLTLEELYNLEIERFFSSSEEIKDDKS